jgi:tRNA G18 (ribose-2'-O)-methylase SpoU
VAVHALTIERVDALDDPRLEDYRAIRDDGLRARGLFAVETREVVRRLLRERRFRLRSLLVTEPALDTLRDLLDSGTTVYLAGQDVIRTVVGFNFHRGCMGIAERGTPLGLEVVDGLRTVLVCERLSNPDNVGGVFRNAMAFGADAVVLSPGCADPLHRKVVRVSIGGSVRVPFVEVTAWPAAVDRLRAAGFTVVALTTRHGVEVSTIAPPAPLALLLGSEGHGLTEASVALADVRATIPMAPGVDSLNVSVACAITLHRLGTPGGSPS